MTQTQPSVKPVVAVGGVMIRDGRVVLVKRGKEPMKGRWTIPGGSVEPGERLAVALMREMREETGLEARAGEVLEIVETIFRDASGNLQYHYVIHDYACEILGGDLRAGGDAAEAALVAEADLPKYGLTESATRVITRAFSRQPSKKSAEQPMR